MNKNKIRIDDTLIRILQREGNVVIPASTYIRYGATEIRNYCLDEFGLYVYIRVIQNDLPEFSLGDEVILSKIKRRRKKELTVILELESPS